MEIICVLLAQQDIHYKIIHVYKIVIQVPPQIVQHIRHQIPPYVVYVKIITF